jgi:hypothetical protein
MSDKSLLDMMLDDSRTTVPERQRGAAQATREEQEPAAPEVAWPQDVEQVLELSGPDLLAWLGEVDPGDLLCVAAEGSEALRTRITGALSEESVAWLRGNLKLWDPATDALKLKSREAVLEVARRLVAEGRITTPGSIERDGQDQDVSGAAARSDLGGMLAQLVAVAHAKGREALAELVDDAEHPMLRYGLRCVLERTDVRDLEADLAGRQRALEAAYRGELELIRQALLSIARGEAPEVFVARVSK